ncbi:cytochrome P450 27C1-like [Stylophora pistillata]|uniref:Cytochrome P450 10 n=1 Tax=Stylophora pistillata TaxID=50429 RepID=A0A2B4RIV3_STYPI|nr:cytochrome P450 27C1-like [Stylophora pistillata]XP_022802150.1 cytochrome P450 27C1-like [Stylophora pistillata]PFX18324.1 Cytochrome P450 10 [Stylophora pistillata]
MDDTLYFVITALLFSVVIWLLNPFGKLFNLLRHLFNDAQGDIPDGVRPFEQLPGPKGLPYFGNVLNHIKTTSDFNLLLKDRLENFEKYGPIFKRTVMGRTMVFIKNPTDVEAVFRGDGTYPMRPETTFRAQKEYMISKKLPEGLTTLQGEKWSRLRKALAPKMLRPKGIRDNLDNFNGVVRDAIAHMASLRGIGDEIPDLEGELSKYATESIGTMAFDVRVGLYDEPPSKETEKMLKMIRAVFDGFALLGKLNRGWEALLYRFMKTQSYRKFVETQDITFSVSQEIIDRKVKELNKMAEEGEQFSENQAVSMLSYLITKGDLTPKEISVNSIFMFRAGVETTTNGLLWVLYDLARNPRVQEKVYEEVTSLVGPHGDFTPESFAKLEYIKACVKESMRLHPAAHSWARVLTQDLLLSGYLVPAGTMVIYFNYLSGRSEELFKFPLDFRPERWLSDDLGKIHPFATLPFGVGSRMCIGRRIAEAEIYLLTAKLIQRFTMEYHDEPMGTKLSFFAVPDRPLKIKFIDRE